MLHINYISVNWGKKQSGICTHTLGKIDYLQFQGQKRLLLSLGLLLKGNDLKSMKILQIDKSIQ